MTQYGPAECDLDEYQPPPSAQQQQDCFDSAEILTARTVLLSVVLALLNVVIVGGNLLVIVAVLVYTKLRHNLTNRFILSLALSDLLLGAAVLPFSTVNLTLDKHWVFGETYCTIWLAVDVWLCTASILNLVAISYERYLAICKPMVYTKRMTASLVHIVIVAVWILAFLICLPSFFQKSAISERSSSNSTANDSLALTDTNAIAGKLTEKSKTLDDDSMNLRTQFDRSRTASDWKSASNLPFAGASTTPSNGLQQESASDGETPCEQRKECTIAESTVLYVVYSFSFSFLIPAVLMIAMYAKIYQTARNAVQNMQSGQIVTKGPKDGQAVTMRVHCGKRDSTVGLLAVSAIGGVARHALSGTSKNNEPSSTGTESFAKRVRRTKRMFSRDSRSVYRNSTGECNAQVSEFTKLSDVSQPAAVKAKAPVCSERNGLLAPASAQALRRHTVVSVGHTDSRIATHEEQLLKIEQLEAMYKCVNTSPKQRAPRQRETKAAKICFILVFGFLAMWMPFFLAYLLTSFCADCLPAVVWDVFFFLGYLNSAVNVVVYAAFSRDFREAFVGLLTGSLLRERRMRQEQVRKQFATRALLDASMRLQGNVAELPNATAAESEVSLT